MHVTSLQWTPDGRWSTPAGPPNASAQLVLYFGANAALGTSAIDDALRSRYPAARRFGCSTAGEIAGIDVREGSVAAVALELAHSRVQVAYRSIADARDSAVTGESLARDLDPAGLVHAFVLAEGLRVNGSELVKGLRAGLPAGVAVTGGLAGDGERFGRTSVYLDGWTHEGGVAIVGFYGERLRVGCGSLGGWDPFGPERLVTRSAGNVLYELDGSSALALYRTYLGPYAVDLPASGLLFPLSLRGVGPDPGVVRTILGIDEEAGSLVFAGDVPQGSYARLMKSNVDRLIDGAHGAAEASRATLGGAPELAILISCVGRKLVLKQRVEEELEIVREVFGAQTPQVGFYSYGEIAPFAASGRCELHNQTMTITALSER